MTPTLKQPPTLTRTLKQIIETYKTTLPENEFLSLEKFISTHIQQHMTDFANYPAGEARGRRVHELIEAEIAKAAHIPVSCKKGCGACCHLEVDITQDDAAVLARAILDGNDIDLKRLTQLSLRERQGKEWQQGVVKENRCVFLGDDNACRVYEYRPSSCRKLSVTSDPANCANTMGFATVPRLIPMAEVIISAALSMPGASYGSFAKKLYEQIGSDQINSDDTQSDRPQELPPL